MQDIGADIDETICPCLGTGWAYRDEIHQECLIHFIGQLHPNTRSLLLDNPKILAEEERKSYLKWRLKVRQNEIEQLNSRTHNIQSEIKTLEHELINRTVTVKIQAVRWEDDLDDSPEITIIGIDYIMDADLIEYIDAEWAD